MLLFVDKRFHVLLHPLIFLQQLMQFLFLLFDLLQVLLRTVEQFIQPEMIFLHQLAGACDQ